jgi:hypothetical protein
MSSFKRLGIDKAQPLSDAQPLPLLEPERLEGQGQSTDTLLPYQPVEGGITACKISLKWGCVFKKKKLSSQ